MRDGHSTAGTPGPGSARSRGIGPVLDIYSAPGRGTAVLARLTSKAPAAHRSRRRAPAGSRVPITGEERLRRRLSPRGWTPAWTLIVADGLGHGPAAAEASQEAARASSGARQRRAQPTMLDTIHAAPAADRGAPPWASPLWPERAELSLRRRRQRRGSDRRPALASPAHGFATTERPATSPARIRDFTYPLATARSWSCSPRTGSRRAGRWSLPRPDAASPDPDRRRAAAATSAAAATTRPCWSRAGSGAVKRPLLTLPLEREDDVVAARQRARQIAELLGFERAGPDPHRHRRLGDRAQRDQYGGRQVASAVAWSIAAARAWWSTCATAAQASRTSTPILEGRYRSQTGMGVGISGARRLMDRFDMRSSPGEGHDVTLAKRLPRRP